MTQNVYKELFKETIRDIIVAETNELKQTIETLRQEIIDLKNGDVDKSTYSVLEAANRLGMSKTQVRNLFNKGALEGYQESTGGKIYIYAESVKNFGRN
ncbi:hypothetical protein [Algivirga pacifica]|uniref:Helix-turn-helix domain-containing protein n=1 Tax=Algivirga pacifica TaxID=1162670 RepID=A0ABP9DGI0_9BACT